MAAPTTVRVEAESMTTTRLRWAYSGSNNISIYRSTDGSSYTRITSVVSTVTEYEDIGLAEATKYWYKLSDDNGSTFSSVVTVWTHSCVHANGGQGTILPLAGDENEPVIGHIFNELSATVQSKLVRFESPNGRVCTACVEDGALVINCLNYDGCEEIEVLVDQDINSISLPECDDSEVDINFIIPPNTTRGICGWPRGIGFTGDECTRAPVRGGSSGRSINEFVNRALNRNSRSGRSKPGNSTQGTPGGGQSRTNGSCTCTPGSNGELTIRACTPSGGTNPNNSLGCQNATPGMTLVVCGGRGPYTWSTGGSVNLSATTGTQTRVTPPTNSGSGEAGNAYKVCHYVQQRVPDCAAARTILFKDSLIYGCNDQLITDAGNSTSCAAAPAASVAQCVDSLSGCDIPECALSGHADHYAMPAVDIRTAPMIAAGCNPCGVQTGTVITVTDATGNSTTITIRS